MKKNQLEIKINGKSVTKGAFQKSFKSNLLKIVEKKISNASKGQKSDLESGN